MSRHEIKEKLENLMFEAEVLSYKQFWTGEDYARNRQIRDEIYLYNSLLESK